MTSALKIRCFLKTTAKKFCSKPGEREAEKKWCFEKGGGGRGRRGRGGGVCVTREVSFWDPSGWNGVDQQEILTTASLKYLLRLYEVTLRDGPNGWKLKTLSPNAVNRAGLWSLDGGQTLRQGNYQRGLPLPKPSLSRAADTLVQTPSHARV